MTNLTENVANEKVQDLTEKMRKGKLKRGLYWVVVNADGDKSTQPCVWGSEFDDFEEVDDEDLSFITAGNINQREHFSICWEQVLAPVPSYEEWQKLNGGYDWLTLSNKALIEENQKLFNLLFIAAKSLQDMADGKIPYTSFGYYAKQILEQIKEQK